MPSCSRPGKANRVLIDQTHFHPSLHRATMASVMFRASAGGWLEKVSMLLDEDASLVHARDASEVTPLMKVSLLVGFALGFDLT
jgi:hypothetical protein